MCSVATGANKREHEPTGYIISRHQQQSNLVSVYYEVVDD